MTGQVDVHFTHQLQAWHLYRPPQRSLVPALFKDVKKVDILQLKNRFNLFFKTFLSRLKAQYQYFGQLEHITYRQLSTMRYGFDAYLLMEVRTDFGQFIFAIEEALVAQLMTKVLGMKDFTVNGLQYTNLEKVLFQQIIERLWQETIAELDWPLKPLEFEFIAGRKRQFKWFSEHEPSHEFSFVINMPGLDHSYAIKWICPRDQLPAFRKRMKPMAHLPIRFSPRVQKQLMTTLEAHLGQAELSLQDFVDLQAGDVLVLKKKVNELVEVDIGNELFFEAIFGQRDGKVAVKLLTRQDGRSALVAGDSDGELADPIMEKLAAMDREPHKEKEPFKSVLNDESVADEFDWETL